MIAPDFARAAETLVPTDEEVGNFNARHELSLVLGPHVGVAAAQRAVDNVTPRSLAFIEYQRFDDTQPDGALTSPYENSSRSWVANAESPNHRLLENLKVHGLYFNRLKRTQPEDYAGYLRALQAEFDEKGMVGPSYYSSYFAKICTGLLEKECVYTPGDASRQVLPKEMYDQALEDPELLRAQHYTDLDVPSATIYAALQNKGQQYSNLHHYRDMAVVKRLVSLDEDPYRNALGYGPQDVLPTSVIRGAAHMISLTTLLDTYGISYQIAQNEEVAGDLPITPDFGVTPESEAVVRQRAERYLDALASSEGHTDALDAQDVKAIVELGAQSAAHFVTARELLVRASSSRNRSGFKAILNRRRLQALRSSLMES